MILRLVLPLALMALLAVAPAGAAELEGGAQTDRVGGVTVKVTPRSMVPSAGSWDFEVELTTHTVPLDQDMVRAAVLIDDAGVARAPLAWEGDAPGGHHRKGVLRFQPLPAWPAVIELRIHGVGGVEERVFRWRVMP